MKAKQVNRKRHKKTEAQMKRTKKPKTCLPKGYQLPDDAVPEVRGGVSMHPDGVWRPIEPLKGATNK